MVVGYILNVVNVLGMPKRDLFRVFKYSLLVTRVGVRTVESFVLLGLEIRNFEHWNFRQISNFFLEGLFV